MYVCPRCCIQLIALQACCLCAPVFPIVSETHSNITSNTDKIQGKHFHNHFPALSFTTSSPSPLSFPLFLHIPFLHFAFCLNSVSEGNWEHVGLSGPIIHFDLEMSFSPGRRASFPHPNFKKVARTRQFFNCLTLKCASRYSGVPFFHIPSSKNAPNPSVF